MKKIVVGIIAHVDSGKTTLSESLLYTSGSIRKLGRVDNQDAFLDTNQIERERGITIFSKQAQIQFEDLELTLLDTPGHVDFSAEMERTLRVLDYAILVISGADGVQSHTKTLWKLLRQYQIPTFLFINKMDQNGTNQEQLMEELRQKLGEGCVDFTEVPQDSQLEDLSFDEEKMEHLAVCEETMLEEYLETGTLRREKIRECIRDRKVFPCYFGSALKMMGVETFLRGVDNFTVVPQYVETFGAKVYKINRDEQGNRLTHVKITGGTLHVKDAIGEEKVNQIRIYSGVKYEMVNEAPAGTVCALTGLNDTYAGQGIGAEQEAAEAILEPVLIYQILLPQECNANATLQKLQQLEEEEPQLHIAWDEELQEIQAQLMGEVQIEILKRLIRDRFGMEVEFGPGNIVYKETIAAPVEGVGHFEPLRHYAEVHLLLEPGQPGSGMQFDVKCSEDILAKNWQRLILTHLKEREHKGVLTGSVITDMKITLVSGRAHIKHTEGGDFRQATYRAVRQGLKKAKSVLLEPYYQFQLEVPTNMVGRAMSDLEKMCGTFGQPEQNGEQSVLTGQIPVSTVSNYQNEVISYTKGLGRLNCEVLGYRQCHNEQEVVERIGYDSERDLLNPTGSVFCAHGAGFIVDWNQVEDYMHLESQSLEFGEDGGDNRNQELRDEAAGSGSAGSGAITGKRAVVPDLTLEEEKELEQIFVRTYGEVKKKKDTGSYRVVNGQETERKKVVSTWKKQEKLPQYLLVDGYNVIFAWEELKELAAVNLDSARDRLMDILSNYQGYKRCTLILVFDAYKVKGFTGEKLRYHNIHVVFTREAQTADQYIEQLAHEIGHKYDVTVATSDGLEQVIIRGQGCKLLSARDLEVEVELVNREIRERHLDKHTRSRNYLMDYLDEETAEQMTGHMTEQMEEQSEKS